MSSRRSRFEIYIDILASINAGCRKPTKIMHTANLSWVPMCEMLDNLQEQGLIEKNLPDNKDNRVKALYEVTNRGLKVLRYYRRALEYVDIRKERW